MLALLVNLLFHSLIAHKEYRFIWLSTWSIAVLAGITSISLLQWLAARRGQTVTPLMLAALGVLWLAASFAAQATSGGARALRGGAPIPLAANDAAVRKETCGIALPDQWRAYLVPALLAREVPLYVAPAWVLGQAQPLPAGLANAADVLIFPAKPQGAENYRELACRANSVLKACVYVRPGGCQNDPNWSYQAALQREDL